MRYIVTLTYEDVADEFSEPIEDTITVEAENDGVARQLASNRLLAALEAQNPRGEYRTEVVRLRVEAPDETREKMEAMREKMAAVSSAYQLLADRQDQVLIHQKGQTDIDVANAYGIVLSDMYNWLNGKDGLKAQMEALRTI